MNDYMEHTTRAEHLAFCKRRALDLVDAGHLHEAFSSMGSDLEKHRETKNHRGMEIGVRLLINGHLETDRAMREFIEGFN